MSVTAKDLLDAAARGDGAAVKALLAKGADANAGNADGTTALMLASRNGDRVTVQRLLQKGVNVNARSVAGTTALDEAPTVQIRDILIKAGAKAKWSESDSNRLRNAHKPPISLDAGSAARNAPLSATPPARPPVVEEHSDASRFRATDIRWSDGLVLLYKSRSDAFIDFPRIQAWLEGHEMQLLEPWYGQLVLLDNNWPTNHANAHDLTFKYSLLWTASKIELGEPWASVGNPHWSRIISGTLCYDLLARSMAKQLKPPLGVDNITHCDAGAITGLDRLGVARVVSKFEKLS